MAPRPYAKRPASETFASTSKKTRFLHLEEDPTISSERVVSHLDDDGEGLVNSQEPANDADDGDEDMYASAATEEKKPVENVKRTRPSF
ncbi:hypothetical protein BJ322DRAFT_1102625 [Thelephora terrestris]|uniref:Uncharacterized protein n=1 Tax=Thelephora terrestris TaxID=56493 RepID=A0A9P6HSJ3_9AGAM|nr:hypothetical protein BJ322DRAFT_1102625 [Thelephora terrestris]